MTTPRLLTAGFAALLLATSGCRTSPRKAAYPIGLYGVNATNDFALIRAAGFNVIRGPADGAFLDAAQTAGLAVLASPGTMAGREPFDFRRARQTVRRMDRHPALWAWYLSDEPDLHRVAPDELRAAQRCVKAAGARKPTTIVLFNAQQAGVYASIADRLLMDRYPVPWLPIADFGKHLRMARLAAGPSRPLYAVIQAFDWSRYPELLPGETNLRPPSYEELRAMTYLARVNDVEGVFYYCFDDGRWNIRESPETWEALQRVVSEVRLFEALFRARPRWRAFGVHYPDRSQQHNEALDPAIASTVVHVDDGDEFTPEGDYVVAVNTTAREITWQFSWAPPGEGALQEVTGGAWLTPAGGWYTDRFGPYDVRVYGPLPVSEEEAEINARIPHLSLTWRP